MAARRPLLACLLLGAVACAGCGSTKIRHVTTTVTRSSSVDTQPTVASVTTASSTGGGSRAGGHRTRAAHGRTVPAVVGSPRALLLASAAALRHVGAYAMQADLLQSGQRTIVDLSAGSNRSYEASTTTGRSGFQLVALPSSVYLRGNVGFWEAQLGRSGGGPKRAVTLANRWLALPARDRASVTGTLGTLAPGTLARCLTEDLGRLTIAQRRATVDNRPAIIVQDAGNAPGATPSTIAIAAVGPPYPLRFVATGLAHRGGRIDVCNNGRGGGATGTITLSRFGEVPTIQPPTGAQSGPSVPA